MTNPRTDADRLWDAMEAIRTPLLVTRGDLGSHARPMSAILRRAERRIWFLTDRETAKASEIERHPDVCVAFSNGTGLHAAVTGRAAIVDDRVAVKGLWTPSAQAFYPGGPEDRDIVAIRVDPAHGELWDGPSAPVALVRMAAALATGTSADGMGDHLRVAMGATSA